MTDTAPLDADLAEARRIADRRLRDLEPEYPSTVELLIGDIAAALARVRGEGQRSVSQKVAELAKLLDRRAQMTRLRARRKVRPKDVSEYKGIIEGIELSAKHCHALVAEITAIRASGEEAHD